MILQALKDYYDRKAADPESGIAPEGWEWKEIPFIVVLDLEGNLLIIEDTREGEGRNRKGKLFLVPQGVKRTSGVSSNLLWDTATYVFGIEEDGKAKKSGDRAQQKKKDFSARIYNEIPDSQRKRALLKFLEELDQSVLQLQSVWPEISSGVPLVSFRFSDFSELYCRSIDIIATVEHNLTGKFFDGTCLISGQPDHISETHTAIKRVYGAQTSGANLVSFNFDAAKSYGKKQGLNAPVGQRSMFAYTTALNTLLSERSSQRIQIGDASTVFWSSRQSILEHDFSFFFKEPEKDNPDSGTKKIKSLLESPSSGAYIKEEGDIDFYILGLSPNAARLSVRFWQTGKVSDFATRIRRYFEDLQIVKPPFEPEYYSVWRLLVNIAIQDKTENIPPNIAGDFIRSIFEDRPFPQSILQSALRRIRSDTEHRVKPVRAALIKAYINRYLRANSDNAGKEITMELDTEQPSIGYQLGRLFAALEKIQEESNPGLNTSIKDRYYGAACSSPIIVFGTLMRLKNHHLAKMENKGRSVNLDRLVGEIVANFTDFPAHLDLHEQGRFAIGYYHQRQEFFAKKEKNE